MEANDNTFNLDTNILKFKEALEIAKNKMEELELINNKLYSEHLQKDFKINELELEIIKLKEAKHNLRVQYKAKEKMLTTLNNNYNKSV